ncbi:MAG: TadE family protein [Chloroflexota bacterium]
MSGKLRFGKQISGQGHKAQSLIEMTLSFTVILFLLLALIDFGYAFLTWITIRDAAQEGATYGSIHPGTACRPQIRNWVRNSASSTIINISALPDDHIIITSTGSSVGSSINVQVNDEYHILTPLVSLAIGTPNIQLSARISNTILQVDSACP